MSTRRKVVFLDRDGTLNNNEEHYYVYQIQDVSINDGVIEGLRLLLENGFELIIITNQGGVSKGIYSCQEVEKVNQFIVDYLQSYGIPILAVFYCPHHDSIENCLCRKPQPLMLEKAINKYQIDRSKSYLIGDSDSDILCAKLGGLRGVKINKNEHLLSYCKRIISEEGVQPYIE